MNGVSSFAQGVERGGGACGAGGAADAADDALNGAAGERVDEPPRKRAKLPDDAHALRKRVLEHKLVHLKTLRDR